jgi:hypothetical protein
VFDETDMLRRGLEYMTKKESDQALGMFASAIKVTPQ